MRPANKHAVKLEANFKQYSNKIKMISMVSMFALTVLNCTYFIAFYFLSSTVFSEMALNLDLIKAVYFRKTSLENALYGVIESLSLNKTFILGPENPGADALTYYLSKGMENEQVY